MQGESAMALSDALKRGTRNCHGPKPRLGDPRLRHLLQRGRKRGAMACPALSAHNHTQANPKPGPKIFRTGFRRAWAQLKARLSGS